ncbi:hypothetical protein BD769DRAFT_227132 [Suillus cothurnatus]|nr:hypothetical protein BD769DRAFT_1359163 [Suillus cothurnatus]KAG2138773.1 hypothetical protein BD769DRAFT_227132 [Suillus cothurnatus]
MCYKIIQYAEYSCSHQTVTRQQVVDCRSRDCRFSPSHQTGAHSCGSTCSQTMLPDQGLIMEQFNNPCRRCGGVTNGH